MPHTAKGRDQQNSVDICSSTSSVWDSTFCTEKQIKSDQIKTLQYLI